MIESRRANMPRLKHRNQRDGSGKAVAWRFDKH
jgi:hypothetical protein